MCAMGLPPTSLHAASTMLGMLGRSTMAHHRGVGKRIRPAVAATASGHFSGETWVHVEMMDFELSYCPI